MNDERTPPQRDDDERRLQEELEQEFYTALRAAGASAEEAQSCLSAEGRKLLRCS